jgi:hypothetical protein
VREVYVWVEPLSRPALAAGLTKEEIQTKTELALRRMGLKVLPADNSGDAVQLNVMINAAGTDTPLIGLAVEVKVFDQVLLPRTNEVTGACVWQSGETAIVGRSNLRKAAFEGLQARLEKFENAWRSVNPH